MTTSRRTDDGQKPETCAVIPPGNRNRQEIAEFNKALRVSPAMSAGIESGFWELTESSGLVDERKSAKKEKPGLRRLKKLDAREDGSILKPLMTKRLKNLLAGAASIGSVVPVHERPPVKTLYCPASSATDAIRGDWERVGGDLRRAMEKVSCVPEATCKA